MQIISNRIFHYICICHEILLQLSIHYNFSEFSAFVIIGGRLGYILFYDFSDFIHAPWVVFKVWEGGMSFHGGLIGVIFAMWRYGKKIGKDLFEMTDFIAPVAPIGLGAGRMGNFINGELWGKVTTVPWGIVYPDGGPWPRHPSQLYELLLEGVVLFAVLWSYSVKPRPKKLVKICLK